MIDMEPMFEKDTYYDEFHYKVVIDNSCSDEIKEICIKYWDIKATMPYTIWIYQIKEICSDYNINRNKLWSIVKENSYAYLRKCKQCKGPMEKFYLRTQINTMMERRDNRRVCDTCKSLNKVKDRKMDFVEFEMIDNFQREEVKSFEPTFGNRIDNLEL